MSIRNLKERFMTLFFALFCFVLDCFFKDWNIITRTDWQNLELKKQIKSFLVSDGK